MQKILEEVKEDLYMIIEDEGNFEGFLWKNKELLKNLTNENKLFIAYTECIFIDNLFENANKIKKQRQYLISTVLIRKIILIHMMELNHYQMSLL